MPAGEIRAIKDETRAPKENLINQGTREPRQIHKSEGERGEKTGCQRNI